MILAGELVLPNWRPLALDSICDAKNGGGGSDGDRDPERDSPPSPVITVLDIVGQIAVVPTLKIELKR